MVGQVWFKFHLCYHTSYLFPLPPLILCIWKLQQFLTWYSVHRFTSFLVSHKWNLYIELVHVYTKLHLSCFLWPATWLLQVLIHSSWWFSKKASEYLGNIHVCSSVAWSGMVASSKSYNRQPCLLVSRSIGDDLDSSIWLSKQETCFMAMVNLVIFRSRDIGQISVQQISGIVFQTTVVQ